MKYVGPDIFRYRIGFGKREKANFADINFVWPFGPFCPSYNPVTMNFRHTAVRLFLSAISGVCAGILPAQAENLDSLLQVLDTCLLNRAHYEEVFQEKALAVKKQAQHAATKEDALKYWDQLSIMEFGRHGDEALSACEKAGALARQLGRYRLAAVVAQREAAVLGMCGFPWEGKALLESAFEDALLRPYLQKSHYTALYDLYDYFHAYDLPSSLLNRNYAFLQTLEDSIRKYETDSTALSLTFHYSTRKVDDMVVLLKRRLEEVRPEVKGVIATTISNKYFLKRDIPLRDYYWALAAIFNIRSARHDNEALTRLAARMVETGDWRRALLYGRAAYEEALTYNSRSRLLETVPVMAATERHVTEEAQKRLRVFRICVLAVLLLAGCMLLVVVKLKRRNRKLVREMALLRRTLDENEKTAGEWRLAVADKNESAMRFLKLALDSVLKFEQMKQLVLMKLEAGESERLKKMLKNPALLDNFKETCLKRFYVAFLRLHPTFLKEVNALLRPECALVLSDTEIMNNELRLLAFLRIGITDSAHIAAILGVSVNTVYCYRTKIRGWANDRKNIERQIADMK